MEVSSVHVLWPTQSRRLCYMNKTCNLVNFFGFMNERSAVFNIELSLMHSRHVFHDMNKSSKLCKKKKKKKLVREAHKRFAHEQTIYKTMAMLKITRLNFTCRVVV